MKCMLCGTENRAEAQRCKGCGASLTGVPAQPVSRAPSPTVLEPGLGQRQAPAGAPRKTRIASADELAQAASVAAAPPPAAPAPSDRRRRTMYQAPTGAAPEVKAEGQPRIFGFLVTYTHKAQGQSFVLREGKNTVGSAPGLDVSIPEDKAMSGQHFQVMYRQGKVRVRDLDSTNATQVNGEEIWGDSVAAGHADVIKAGETRFTLVLVPGLDAAPEEG